jgi:ribosome-binding protein aMBF1 (putative translation factor)
MPKYPSSAQIRAGRGLLGWSRSDLADKAGVALNTITLMENKPNAQNHATREKVQKVMETAGIAFFDDDEHGGEGVRFISIAHQPKLEANSK